MPQVDEKSLLMSSVVTNGTRDEGFFFVLLVGTYQ
jgi:hypothetical protein